MRLRRAIAAMQMGDLSLDSSDPRLLSVMVQLGENKRSSRCSIQLLDPAFTNAAALFDISFSQGGIAVPELLLGDPQAARRAEGTIELAPSSTSAVSGAVDGRRVANPDIDPRIKAFLDVIAHAEGTKIPAGYNTMFTGTTFSGYERHPDIIHRGAGVASSAAGRYQFLTTTWNELNLNDFSPRNQDAGAVRLLQRRGAINDILSGNISTAIAKCRLEWTSFQVKPVAELLAVYDEALEHYGKSSGPTAPGLSANPVEDSKATAFKEVSKKGTEIIVTLAEDRLLEHIRFHFLHIGTQVHKINLRKEDPVVLSIEGQTIRWLLSRRRINTAYENITLRELVAAIAVKYGLKYEMEGNGPTFAHVEQAETDYALLQREADRVGFRIYDDGITLKLEPVRPKLTEFVLSDRLIKPGTLQFSDLANKDMPVNRTDISASGVASRAEEQATEVDRRTGSIKQLTQEDTTGTATATAAPKVATGSDRAGLGASITGLPTQELGSIDLADGEAEANLIQDESRRVIGYASGCSLRTNTQILQLVPGNVFELPEAVAPKPFARQWRISGITHQWGKESGLETKLDFYSPQRQREASNRGRGAGTIELAPLNAGGFILPVAQGSFGDGIGPRSATRNHNGIDIPAPAGTPLVAAADGVVDRVTEGYGGGWGTHVVIRHANDIFSLCAHMIAGSPRVATGQQVRQGQIIGEVGSTGASSGPHLHVEYRRGGSPPAGSVVIPSTLGVAYTGISGSQRAGFKY